MNRQGLLSTTGLALIALIIGLTAHEWENRVPLGEQEPPQGPALVVEGARAHSFGENGALRYRLTAEQLTRFEREQRTEMLAPRVEVLESAGGWTVDAERGLVEGPDNDLTLNGHVRAERLGTQTLRLRTEELRYLPEQDRVVAPGEVLIEHPGGRTRAGRLRADVGTGVLRLDDRVESRYEAPSA